MPASTTSSSAFRSISRMTVHRHLDSLERQGVLRKLRGAVTVQPSGLYDSSFRYRVSVAQDEKLALARAALEYVDPGEAIMLDDSTTAATLATLLHEVAPLTVITNSHAAAETLAHAEDVELISLGGQFNRTYNAFIGHLCERAVAELRVKTAFLSASAIQGTTAFVQDQHITRIKQAMMAVARTRILMIDHRKFSGLALHKLADLADFDHVLTTSILSPADRAQLNIPEIKLRIVPVELGT
jgi:DeoR/GlpR family transcriptional regulator of sugar metabolism